MSVGVATHSPGASKCRLLDCTVCHAIAGWTRSSGVGLSDDRESSADCHFVIVWAKAPHNWRWRCFGRLRLLRSCCFLCRKFLQLLFWTGLIHWMKNVVWYYHLLPRKWGQAWREHRCYMNTVRCVWYKKLKFNSVVYFGPINGPKLASIFSCKNVVFFQT